MNLPVHVSHLRHPALEPFLDLFVRINDEQIVRLTGVPEEIVQQQRAEIEQIMVALEPFEDLLPRLDDPALARLAEQEEIAIEFWRRCCVPPERLTPSFQRSSKQVDAPAANADDDATTQDGDDDDDDVFVLTIDEEEPKGSSGSERGADDSLDWSDM